MPRPDFKMGGLEGRCAVGRSYAVRRGEGFVQCGAVMKDVRTVFEIRNNTAI
jgi:hypothetical protein